MQFTLPYLGTQPTESNWASLSWDPEEKRIWRRGRTIHTRHLSMLFVSFHSYFIHILQLPWLNRLTGTLANLSYTSRSWQESTKSNKEAWYDSKLQQLKHLSFTVGLLFTFFFKLKLIESGDGGKGNTPLNSRRLLRETTSPWVRFKHF